MGDRRAGRASYESAYALAADGLRAEGPENDLEREQKRARRASRDGGDVADRDRARDAEDVGRWAAVICFDRPFAPLLVDRALLRASPCHLLNLIEHDAPHKRLESGEPAWRLTASHDVVSAFLRSLNLGHMVVPRGVDYDELTCFFEMQGVGFCGSALPCSERTPRVSMGTSRARSPWWKSLDVSRVTGHVAAALLDWPKLALGMASVLYTGVSPGFSCSSSRTWIQFLEPPALQGVDSHASTASDDFVWDVSRCQRNFDWIFDTLVGIGCLEFQLLKRGKMPGSKELVDGTTLFFREARHERANTASAPNAVVILRRARDTGGFCARQASTSRAGRGARARLRAVVAVREALHRFAPCWHTTSRSMC